MTRSPWGGGASALKDFGEVLKGEDAVEPILGPEMARPMDEWLTEQRMRPALKAAGLLPRRRAMFHGAPGTGKTSLAHFFAGRMGLPIVLIRPDRIIDCWLGSTNRSLGALFDAARPKTAGGEGPCILFFDEFEALASKRVAGGANAQREMNSVVDVLLQRFDRHTGIIIAATNDGNEIDPAVWRRFDLHLEFKVPSQEERRRIIALYLQPWGLPDPALDLLAFHCETASPALLRQLCEGLKRSLVLGKRMKWDMSRPATFQRVVGSIEPHPSLGKPSLWATGGIERATAGLPWPLPLAADLTPDEDRPPAPVPPPAASSVVTLAGRRKGAPI